VQVVGNGQESEPIIAVDENQSDDEENIMSMSSNDESA